MPNSDDQRTQAIRDVLATLNEWEREYGTTYGSGAGLGSSGEANARIADLKDKLRSLGAVFQWRGERYVLVKTVAPGSGHQMPDRRAPSDRR
jgi:hypothetical protein